MALLRFEFSQMSLEFLNFRNNLLLLYTKLLLLARRRRGLGRGVGHGRAASELASLVAEMSSICGSRPALALGVGALRYARESWLFGCLGLRQRERALTPWR